MADDRYEIVWFRGHRFDRMTVQALLKVEKRLGYVLTVAQGSYNGTNVKASGGTHAGGGAGDLAPYQADRKVRALREEHFAAWYRPAIPGLWNPHVHFIQIGNEKASQAAKDQVRDYRNHRSGLVSNAHDPTWHPDPITAYRYEVTPTIAIDLSNLRIDFFNVLEGNAGNAPSRRGKVVQRQLNRKVSSGRPLLVDGVIGEKTLDKWGIFERQNGVVDRPRIPDMKNLRALLRGSVYYAVE